MFFSLKSRVSFGSTKVAPLRLRTISSPPKPKNFHLNGNSFGPSTRQLPFTTRGGYSASTILSLTTETTKLRGGRGGESTHSIKLHGAPVTCGRRSSLEIYADANLKQIHHHFHTNSNSGDWRIVHKEVNRMVRWNNTGPWLWKSLLFGSVACCDNTRWKTVSVFYNRPPGEIKWNPTVKGGLQ